MSEQINGDVLHAVRPDELGEHDLEPDLQRLAEGRHVLVLRRGGHPSLLGLLWAFVRRNPIEAVTVITDEGAVEGESVSMTVEETSMAGVYRVV